MRDLNTTLRDFFLLNVLSKGLANESDSPTVLMMAAARSLVGQREKKSNGGPIIDLIHDTVGSPERVAYCMGTVQSCVAFAELVSGVKSTLYASEGVMNTWTKSPVKMRVDGQPKFGDIAIWNYKGTWRGHTGMLIEHGAVTMKLIEGNTSGGISINREGDGIYETLRLTVSGPRMKLKGFLRPF